jgi:hypothetical protein
MRLRKARGQAAIWLVIVVAAVASSVVFVPATYAATICYSGNLDAQPLKGVSLRESVLLAQGRCVDGSETTYRWDLTGPPTRASVAKSGTGPTFYFKPTLVGTYKVTLTATENGQSEQAIETIKVLYGSPTVEYKPKSCTAAAGGTCTIVAGGSSGLTIHTEGTTGNVELLENGQSFNYAAVAGGTVGPAPETAHARIVLIDHSNGPATVTERAPGKRTGPSTSPTP